MDVELCTSYYVVMRKQNLRNVYYDDFCTVLFVETSFQTTPEGNASFLHERVGERILSVYYFSYLNLLRNYILLFNY